MNNVNNIFATIVAFYFAKFDKVALNNLGFASFNEAFKKCAEQLNVKKNYIKFRRDEFDPAYKWRVGWTRPMSQRIINTINILDNISEPDMQDITRSLLYSSEYRESHEISSMVNLISSCGIKTTNVKKQILRGPTGRAAELYFQSKYELEHVPIAGVLTDCRELGCGYDFLISLPNGDTHFVEVKGLNAESGGIMFTDKEWLVSKEKSDKYWLCIVRNVHMSPQMDFIQDPASKFNPTRNIRPIIQISWTLSDKELKNLISNDC